LDREREAFAAFASEMSKQPRELLAPDWEKLLEADPAEYWRQHARWMAGTHPRQVAEVERQKAAAAEVARQRELLLRLVPDWRDAGKAQAGMEAVSRYLAERGYTAEEVAGFRDARYVPVVLDAMAWAAHKAKGAKAGPERPAAVPVPARPVLKPGAARTAEDEAVESRRKVMDQFRKSRSAQDAMAAIGHLLRTS